MVTGANSGSGLALSETLLNRGCSVAMTYHKSHSNHLVRLGKQPHTLLTQLDVTNIESIDGTFRAVWSRFGRLDYLINIASFSNPSLWDIDPLKLQLTDWKAALDVDLTGSFLCSQRAIPLMLRCDGGRIVNLGSSGSMRGDANTFAYNAAKVALVGLTKSIARAYAPKILANLVAPGSVDSGWIERWGLSANDLQNIHALREMPNRHGTTMELAELIAFLLSDQCGYLNGQILYFDGGLSA
jgi:NAD(P)-dependent dehydrogenase (short-subunit alcohol dehydrogenase family)